MAPEKAKLMVLQSAATPGGTPLQLVIKRKGCWPSVLCTHTHIVGGGYDVCNVVMLYLGVPSQLCSDTVCNHEILDPNLCPFLLITFRKKEGYSSMIKGLKAHTSLTI